MDLENISVKGNVNDASEVIEALRKLPEGTIEGISEYGHTNALISRSKRIIIRTTNPPSTDEITINIPEEATQIKCFRETDDACVAFKYKDTQYWIKF